MADSGGTDYTGLLGLLGAAAISSAGAIYNNYQQRKLVGATNDLSVNLANTAHQREVADLYAAGLNPILSAGGNGAPTPSLGTASLDNVLSSFGGSAKSFGDTLSRQRNADIDKTLADTESSIATAKNLEEQNKNLREQNKEIQARIRNIDADTRLKGANTVTRSVVGKIYNDAKEVSKDVINTVRKVPSVWRSQSAASSAKSLDTLEDRAIRLKNNYFPKDDSVKPMWFMTKERK